MLYASTRTDSAKLTFDEAVMAGLAPDGGLYLPERLPYFSGDDIRAMRGLSYSQLACRIMLPFMGEGWDEARLMPLLEKSYFVPPAGGGEENAQHSKGGCVKDAASDTHPPLGSVAASPPPPAGGAKGFRHAYIAPLVELSAQHHVLELFHGPTLAFKDFALQFLGHVLGDILQRSGQQVMVVGATSGDTGSAAIAGLAGQDSINIHILYPHGRVSEVQRRQMTTVKAANVHALAIDGTFDDCQNMVKAMFQDRTFNDAHHLVAVNSINWARIMAQIVYYFYAALRLGAPEKVLNFSVPTGNFGDIYAGWLAGQMGLPVGKLIIATNENDILARCWQSGNYEMKPVKQTLSPSMDIQISSNFERLLYDYFGRDGQAIELLMQLLKDKGTLHLTDAVKARFTSEFAAFAVDDAETSATIKRVYAQHHMLLDPHTATGVRAAEQFLAAHPGEVVVTLATAHPAKFPDAVKAATGQHPELPEHMKDLFDLPERSVRLANDLAGVREFIASAQSGE